jgi:copper chaperone CopZ
MIQTTLKIDGMMCVMCEAHVCDTIRRAFPEAKKVKASRKSGEATFLSDGGIDEEALKKAITDTGYTFVSVSSEEYKKRGLFGR